MKSTKTLFLIALTLAALTAGVWAETPGSGAPAANAAAPAPAPPTVVTAADVQALKDAVAAQQLQIQRLTEQLQRQQAWQSQQSAAAAPAKTEAAPTQAVPQQLAEANTSAAPQQETAPSPGNPQDTPPQTPETPMHGPVSIHFRGITITPGGFVEAAFLRRSRELGADLPTPFNSLTMPGASQSYLPEFFGSGRQSRASVYVDGRLSNVELSSYISADFLSAGVTSSATQTNSYTLRLRQAWGQARFDNGWKLLGGQAWSLVTENKGGIAPSDDQGRVNDARPATIDPQYTVGFTFARQYGLRLTKDFNEHISAAIAVENPQGTLATSNNADNFLLGEAGASNSYNTTSTYTANPSPDVIAKIAFDQGPGHYEIFGLADRCPGRVFPCVEPGTNPVCPGGTPATGAYNASKEGGGFGFNVRWTVANKHVVFGLHEFGGTGIGRYGAAQLPDVSIHANGTLDLIRDYQGLGTLEYHGKKLDVYSYAGVEYAGRAYDFDPLLNSGAGGYVGYGAPEFSNAGCYNEVAPAVKTGLTPSGIRPRNPQAQAILEGTTGFWYRFYNGPRGKFQFGTQYSYVTRDTWSGVAGPGTSGSPSGIDNMVFTSFRFYLP